VPSPPGAGSCAAQPRKSGFLGGACGSRGLGGLQHQRGAAVGPPPVGKPRGELSVAGRGRAWPAVGLAQVAPHPRRHPPPRWGTLALIGAAAARAHDGNELPGGGHAGEVRGDEGRVRGREVAAGLHLDAVRDGVLASVVVLRWRRDRCDDHLHHQQPEKLGNCVDREAASISCRVCLPQG
jgi:hypothetical protein